MSSKEIEQSLLEFLEGDDLDFYETFLVDLSEKEIDLFFQENPEFMEKYHVYEGRRALLQDKMYRGILKRIARK